MTDDPSAALRERARAWGRSILASAPWSQLATRAALLLVSPPRVEWPLSEARFEAWLLLEAVEARALPNEARLPLQRLGVLIQPAGNADGQGDLSVLIVEGAARAAEGASRRALELRWLLGHAEALHDPLRRLETLALQAVMLPEDVLERVLRPLWLQLIASMAALETGGVVAAGEAAAAGARILCVLETGIHPPADWLANEARQTELAPRLGGWLEELPRVAGGDEASVRRALAGRDAVRRLLGETLKHHLGAPDWLTAPEAYSLRPPR